MGQHIHPIMFPTLLILLMGAGCITTSSSSTTDVLNRTPESVPETDQLQEEVFDEETNESQYTPLECPEGTRLFEGEAATFCYDEETALGEPIRAVQSDSMVTLMVGSDTTFVHTVQALTFDETMDPLTAIETLYMKDADKEICEVISSEDADPWREYLIASGSLDTQESCGTYRAGFFRFYEDFPGTLLYIEVGQDTFFPSATWLETLRPVR